MTSAQQLQAVRLFGSAYILTPHAFLHECKWFCMLTAWKLAASYRVVKHGGLLILQDEEGTRMSQLAFPLLPVTCLSAEAAAHFANSLSVN